MILIIDNYDSFTYNLMQRFGEIDSTLDIRVVRNDEMTVSEIQQMKPDYLVVSPGPCTPKEAGISVDAVTAFHGTIPILGVCLGHQSIGAATGGKIVRAERLMHGKTDQIHHSGTGLFKDLPNPMTATRYHSLIIRPDTLSSEFDTVAWAASPTGEKEIMAIQHRDKQTFGVQFHPESFLSENGTDLLRNFIGINQ